MRMRIHREEGHCLRETIQAAISGSPTREEVNCLIHICHSLAHPFLMRKIATGSLLRMQGSAIADLAYDCIAELFQTDDGGTCTQLRSYFCGIPLAGCEDEEILPHLRKLVFSKVNQAVFRLYTEYDPALSKILRNIKSAVHSFQNFIPLERFGEPCFVPSTSGSLQQLPPYTPEELEMQFLPRTTGREHIPELLAKLSLHLRQQDTRCRIIPLMTIGMLFRSVYAGRYPAEEIVLPGETMLNSHDALMAIRQACREVEVRMRRKYLGRKKVSGPLLRDYFQVIEEHLEEKIVSGNGSDHHLYESLRSFYPGLTKTNYYLEHRNRLEYILKLVQKETLRRLHES